MLGRVVEVLLLMDSQTNPLRQHRLHHFLLSRSRSCSSSSHMASFSRSLLNSSSKVLHRGKICLNFCPDSALPNLYVSSKFLLFTRSSSFDTWPHPMYPETGPPKYKQTSAPAKAWTMETLNLRKKKNGYYSGGERIEMIERISENFQVDPEASQVGSKYENNNFQKDLSRTDIESVNREYAGHGQMHSQTSLAENTCGHVDQKGKNPVKTTYSGKKMNKEQPIYSEESADLRKKLSGIYGKILVVDNVYMAKKVVSKLTHQYQNFVHACDTEVAKIDVNKETPVDHGEIICFSIYSGPQADFGNGRSCIWIDVLDGNGRDILVEFAPFFEDPKIKKVWHNYSFDNHIVENYGIKVSGFHADTMHMARLWDSSRQTEGGYSLEALTKCIKEELIDGNEINLIGKISMKTVFGRRKLKGDGSEGKIITIPPVEELQRDERELWICYSVLNSISTLKLYESLKSQLMQMDWKLDGLYKGDMLDFYELYWQPFGELLVKMETEGMLVDREYLAEIEKIAIGEQQEARDRFCNWASRYCPDAKYMNVGSDIQLRQLFFGGIPNRKKRDELLPQEGTFRVREVIHEGNKTVTKLRNITLHSIVNDMPTEMYTATGWPSICEESLKILAGKASAEYEFFDDEESKRQEPVVNKNMNANTCGTAYKAFGKGRKGKEACHAIASLCQVRSIDSLISNFILPLQESDVAGKDGRIHCSLNINTETGRLSARRPNLQNQPALEKDRYMIRKAFIAAPGNSLIVADYGQLELRILAHLADCKSMLEAFKAGGDFHSRTAMNMYPHIREAVEQKQVLLEYEDNPSVPLLKDVFGSERRKAKMLNFSIAYGKTPMGLSRDWKVSVKEARETVSRWYSDRQEVLTWQEERKHEAHKHHRVQTLLGRARLFPALATATSQHKAHIERAAINTPVQGSAADVAMCAMLEISKNKHLKELGWRLLLQVHDEVILEGPTESAEMAKAIVVECMQKPFNSENILKVDLAVDAKCAQNWYSAK